MSQGTGRGVHATPRVSACRACTPGADTLCACVCSPQIATTKISWSCAAAPNDVISIEVWEVIDRCTGRVEWFAFSVGCLFAHLVSVLCGQGEQEDGRRGAPDRGAVPGAPGQEECGGRRGSPD